MSAERTCLFCGGEITPENILFSYKAYAGVSYEDELRTSFLSSCSNGLEARVGENQGGTTRYKALYYETSHAYDMETDASGLPINMLKVPVNAGLTPVSWSASAMARWTWKRASPWSPTAPPAT